MPDNAALPVVLFCNGYGDSLLSLPGLRALDRVFEDGWHLICHFAVAKMLFKELSASRCELDFQTTGNCKRFNAKEVLKKIPTCDTFISLVPWGSPDVNVLLKAWRPHASFGFHGDVATRLPLNFELHSARLTFEIPKRLAADLVFEDFLGAPQLPALAIKQASTLLEGLGSSCKLLTVHVDTLSEKMWPMARWRLLLDRFLGLNEDYVALVLGTTEFDWEMLDHANRVLTGYGLPLDVAMALVAKADLFLGVDSCLLHTADFFGVAGVGLFGATSAREFGFLMAPHVHVCAGSMDAITVDQVMSAVNGLLACTSTAKPIPIG